MQAWPLRLHPGRQRQRAQDLIAEGEDGEAAVFVHDGCQGEEQGKALDEGVVEVCALAVRPVHNGPHTLDRPAAARK